MTQPHVMGLAGNQGVPSAYLSGWKSSGSGQYVLGPLCRTYMELVTGVPWDGHPIEFCGFFTDTVQTSPSQMTEQKAQPLLLVMQNRTWYLESNHAVSTKAKHTPTHTLMTQ